MDHKLAATHGKHNKWITWLDNSTGIFEGATGTEIELYLEYNTYRYSVVDTLLS